MRCTVFQLPREIPERHVRQAFSEFFEESRLRFLLQRVDAEANGAVWTSLARLQRLFGKSTKKRRLAAAAIAENENFHAPQWFRILRLLEEIEN